MIKSELGIMNKESRIGTNKKPAFGADYLTRMRHSLIYKSLISKPALKTSTSLPAHSLSEIFDRNISRLAFWLASVGGKILSTILPGVFSKGYSVVLRKSVSLVSRILDSFTAISKRWEFFTPLSAAVMSWPEALSQRINRSLTFSSANNFTFKGDEFFSFCQASCVPECSGDMLASDGGKVFENLFDCLSGRKHLQNLPNHYPSTPKSRLATADIRIGHNILVDFDSFHTSLYYNYAF